MSYFPKSRIITSQKANPGEFITEEGKSYVGSYYITYDGKYFAGDNPQTVIKLPLIKSELPKSGDIKIPKNKDTSTFNRLNKGNISMVELIEPSPFYPKPTEQDYSFKKITRYFAKQRTIRNFKIIEIDQNTYTDLFNEGGIYNYPLWKVTSLFWQISGPLYDERPNGTIVRAGVIDTNQRIIDNKEKTFSGIKQYLTNLQQFYKP